MGQQQSQVDSAVSSSSNPARLVEARLRQLARARREADYAWVGSAPFPSQAMPPPPAALHWDLQSDGYEFAFVLRGAARVITPISAFEMTPGRVLLMGRNVEHYEAPVSPNTSYRACWCSISGSHARVDNTAYAPGQGWRKGPGIALVGRTDVENIAVAVASEIANRETGWVHSVKGLLDYLSFILIRRLRRGNVLRLPTSESPTISADPRAWRAVQKALRVCEANFHRPLGLAEVSAAVGYSPSHLSRLISTHLGHPFQDHIRTLRVNAAKQLLESSEMAVSEIARSLGYADVSYFSHAFTRATGMSPRSYRKSRPAG
jgi:AraC-like DNA-binding protein